MTNHPNSKYVGDTSVNKIYYASMTIRGEFYLMCVLCLGREQVRCNVCTYTFSKQKTYTEALCLHGKEFKREKAITSNPGNRRKCLRKYLHSTYYSSSEVAEVPTVHSTYSSSEVWVFHPVMLFTTLPHFARL